MTAVVVDGHDGKEYRLPSEEDIESVDEPRSSCSRVFAEDSLRASRMNRSRAVEQRRFASLRPPLWGRSTGVKLFTPRQLLAIGNFREADSRRRESRMNAEGIPAEWARGGRRHILHLASIDSQIDAVRFVVWTHPTQSGVDATHSQDLPFRSTWDFIEGVPTSEFSGGYLGCNRMD